MMKMLGFQSVSVRLTVIGAFALSVTACSTVTVYRNPLPEGSPGTAILQISPVRHYADYALLLRKETTCEKNWAGVEQAKVNGELLFLSMSGGNSQKSQVVPAGVPLKFLYQESVRNQGECSFMFSAILEQGKTYSFQPKSVSFKTNGLFGEQIQSGCSAIVTDLALHTAIPLVPESRPTTLEACGRVSSVEEGMKGVDQFLKRAIDSITPGR